jgi:hypothetical protein
MDNSTRAHDLASPTDLLQRNAALKARLRNVVNVDGLGVLGKRFNGSGTSKSGRVVKPSKRLKG